MKKFGVRERLCSVSFFIAVIGYVLVGYYTKCYTWSLFIFLIVPLMPFLLGIKKINISYDLLIIIVYLILGFSIGGWHPWWVLFLTIPVYHIIFDDLFKKKKEQKNHKNDDDVEIMD